MTTAVNVGETAPDFELASADGGKLRLSDLRGKNVVLYFYPRAFSGGCSTQACSLRDGYPDLQAKNVEVVGVSVDDIETQKRFKEENHLPFRVLADDKLEVSKRYGVYGSKRPDGTMSTTARRVTIIIDEKGVIKQVIDPAHADAHVDEVMAALSA